MTQRPAASMETADFVWALAAACRLHQLPISPSIAHREFPPPHGGEQLVEAFAALGLHGRLRRLQVRDLRRLPAPYFLLRRVASCAATNTQVTHDGDDPPTRLLPCLILQSGPDGMLACDARSSEPQPVDLAELRDAPLQVVQFKLARAALTDPDADPPQKFGLRWFAPLLRQHQSIWRDVLFASLLLQTIALATPLLTQAVIDKVVVHQTVNTLVAIGIALMVCTLFTAALGWVRQYLILHTGNRIDAVLGATVFGHLLRLPPRYFEQRPTGVIAARLHAVETVREFVSSSIVTLLLDIPFLLIFLALMCYYSIWLSAIVVAIVGLIVVLSLVMAPVFRARLNQQFLLGARNQAFLTEYVAGIDTVKSLQMEPQLQRRYGAMLNDYLAANFGTRQLANSYQTLANGLEQVMSLLILCCGAYLAMHEASFTIGMLVAFQMFAARFAQPMLRLVGLWQQFQEAGVALRRLADIMDAPAEPYSVQSVRTHENRGAIAIEQLGFRHADDLPYLFRELSLDIAPGTTIALMGPSGSGKSSLARLLLGHYRCTEGTIRIDGVDTRHLAANELRAYFGVVPQETVLFSGTVYDNLLAGEPHASFEQVVAACRMAEIHTAIEALPQGYQSTIGERGIGLSGGQRQRLAIARALLKRPRVLLFDEATSSLDSHTAEGLARTLNALRGSVTVVFITHALPRGLHVDSVVRLGDSGNASALGRAAASAG